MNWLKLLQRKYNTISRLSKSEKSLLFQALWLLPIVAILVQTRGLRVTRSILLQLPLPKYSSPNPPPLNALEIQVWTTVRLVRVAVGYNYLWTNCLKQSLVLWILLRSQGIISELRIGIERSTKFSAHAWVEYQGIVLNDTDDVHQRFQAFDRAVEQPIGEKL